MEIFHSHSTANCNAEIKITDIKECEVSNVTVKELFDNAENGTLTWEQFEAAAKTANAKFTDLNEGNYVSKRKYEDDIASRDTQISTLNDTVSNRDKDLANVKKQLEEAGTDAEKLTTLTNDLEGMKTKYANDTKLYKEQLKKQAYEFAVKDFANSKKFTSNAAKRDFIQSMIAKDLKLENDKIIGADDFVEMYSTENEDAFAKEVTPTPAEPKPTFVNHTQGGGTEPNNQNPFMSAFHFTGVRSQPNQQ